MLFNRDKSLQIDVYKVQNLPAVDPGIKVQFYYVLEGQYLAVSNHSMHSSVYRT